MSTNYRDLVPYDVVDLEASARVSTCLSRSVGKFIAPFVPVNSLTGRVKLFGTSGLVRKDNLSAPGDFIRSRNVENGINPISYDLLSNRHAEAAVVPVDLLKECWTNGICDKASLGNLLDGAIDDAVRSIMISHSTSTVDLATAQANYKAGNYFATATARGWVPWSQAAANPIVNIATDSVGLLKKNSPYMANAAVIGQNVYAVLQGNAALVNRFTNVQVGQVTEALMANLLGLTDVYVADDSVINPVTGEYESIFPANGLLLFNRDQTHKQCQDFTENVSGRTKFSSFYTYVPSCGSYAGGIEISEPDYVSEIHSIRSNVLSYYQPLGVGALANGLQGTALYINDVLA